MGKDSTITVPVTHEGENIVELEAAPGPTEQTLQNNRAAIVINGIRDRLRVLLVSGEPHAGERVWRNLLKADPSVDLVHFTILRPPDKRDNTPINELALIIFPTRELFAEKLNTFDLVILDRYQNWGDILPLAYFENLAKYVENGGALLVSSGPEFVAPDTTIYRTPLASVLPAQPTGDVINQAFRPQVTKAGLAHPVTRDLPQSNAVTEAFSAPLNPSAIANAGPGQQQQASAQDFTGTDAAPANGTPPAGAAPANGAKSAAPGTPNWGHWFRMIAADKISGNTVMSGPQDRPLLVLDRVQKGRVAQLLSDQIWLWARGYDGGGPQAELLRRLAHWLMKEPELEEERLTAEVSGGMLRVTRQTMADKAAAVNVITPTGKTESVALAPSTPGRFTGELKAEELGLYRMNDGSLNAVAAAGPLNPREVADMRATDAVLRPYADVTGGGVHWLSDGMPELTSGANRAAPRQAAAGSASSAAAPIA